MQLLNLINKDRSDIQYNIFHFPDGEVQISFPNDFDRKDSVGVLCRITSAEELFLLAQVGDILDRQEIEWNLYITYLMSMRMDRVMDFNRPFTLKVVWDIINRMNYKYIHVLEAHSSRTESLFGSRYRKSKFDYSSHISPTHTVVFPDAGAFERYKSEFVSSETLIFNKKRDLATGKITSFEIAKYGYTPTYGYTFIDDLCDGGGTFLGELKVLKEQFSNCEFRIVICHAVNEEGIIKLCDNFDKVIISNSYKDWNIYRDNLTIVNVCH